MLIVEKTFIYALTALVAVGDAVIFFAAYPFSKLKKISAGKKKKKVIKSGTFKLKRIKKKRQGPNAFEEFILILSKKNGKCFIRFNSFLAKNHAKIFQFVCAPSISLRTGKAQKKGTTCQKGNIQTINIV